MYRVLAGAHKRDAAGAESDYRAVIDRVRKPLVASNSAGHASSTDVRNQPRSLEQCFAKFTGVQQLGPDGYCCHSCNEGEHLL